MIATLDDPLNDVFYHKRDWYGKLLEDFRSSRNSWLRSIRNLSRRDTLAVTVRRVLFWEHFITYDSEVEAIEEYIK